MNTNVFCQDPLFNDQYIFWYTSRQRKDGPGLSGKLQQANFKYYLSAPATCLITKKLTTGTVVYTPKTENRKYDWNQPWKLFPTLEDGSIDAIDVSKKVYIDTDPEKETSLYFGNVYHLEFTSSSANGLFDKVLTRYFAYSSDQEYYSKSRKRKRVIENIKWVLVKHRHLDYGFVSLDGKHSIGINERDFDWHHVKAIKAG